MGNFGLLIIIAVIVVAVVALLLARHFSRPKGQERIDDWSHALATDDSDGESRSGQSSKEDLPMGELFTRFLESPGRESYIAVRTALVSSDYYDAYSNEIDELDQLLDAGKFEEASRKLTDSMPNLLLSPQAHLIMSFIADKLNDEKGAHAESFIAAACCKGILATGDGTKDKPYIVVRVSDEYDVLQYVGKGFELQSLIHDGNRHFDLVKCQDGSELWFDITDAFNKRRELFGDGAT